ncbi:hypothetical protein GF1_19360 [Desulfolithobacter dissulfuricans]|uniref:Uncharacterized protein n=1 Tax=Desulfolithobacter dissulfuricans TaxID=2795293 RepID=A0A915UAH3_9BACT|nr:hypothetical protein [Desulfolithobacter dissulfuricans]BCO09560.1 hypothetical protein GF1_19360 [Desulfolithobacter dissulfuricans]
MLDKNAALATVLARCRKLDPGQAIELLTWKKDRSVRIIRLEDGRLRVEERGFERQDFVVQADKLKKLLRTLIKREFPRSHKIRMTIHGA